jgi:hypothetical protein
MNTYEGKIKSGDGVFVFGSNTEGRHGKGAAKVAKDNFGAVYGQSFGRQGMSFAIITKDLTKKVHPSVSVSKIISQILYFYLYAEQNKQEKFYVAYSGLDENLNGFKNEQMAKMFSIQGVSVPDNIYFEWNFAKLIK